MHSALTARTISLFLCLSTFSGIKTSSFFLPYSLVKVVVTDSFDVNLSEYLCINIKCRKNTFFFGF